MRTTTSSSRLLSRYCSLAFFSFQKSNLLGKTIGCFIAPLFFNPVLLFSFLPSSSLTQLLMKRTIKLLLFVNKYFWHRVPGGSHVCNTDLASALMESAVSCGRQTNYPVPYSEITVLQEKHRTLTRTLRRDTFLKGSAKTS